MSEIIHGKGRMSLETNGAAAEPLDMEQLYLFVVGLRHGDFSRRLPTDGTGRAKEVAMHLNSLSAQLQAATSEVTRVATEIGAEGRLGPICDAHLPPGLWRAMIESVNVLAWNITAQVRDMSATMALAAAGSYGRPVTVNCQGELLELKTAINSTMAARHQAAIAGD